MRVIDKWQSVLLLAAVIFGLAAGQLPSIEKHSAAIIFPCLFLLLYGLFLSVPVKAVTKAFHHRTFTLVSAGLNFVWTPVLAWGLGAIFLSDHPAMWLGFIMLLVTPCTDWYLVFTSMAKGNVALSTALLPINLILQVTLLPVYIALFTGTTGHFQISGLIGNLVLIVIVPFLLAWMTNFLLGKSSNRYGLQKKIYYIFADGQVVFLSLAIAAIFASRGNYLFSNGTLVFIILLPLFSFYLVNFAVGRLVSKIVDFTNRETISLHFTTMARNSPLALSIAYAAFPDQPLLILVLVTGSLVELPVLAAMARILPAIPLKHVQKPQ